MGTVKRDNLIHISIVEIALHIFTGNDTAHRMADKDVAGSKLAVEIGILANEFESGLTI